MTTGIKGPPGDYRRDRKRTTMVIEVPAWAAGLCFILALATIVILVATLAYRDGWHDSDSYNDRSMAVTS